MLVARLLGTLLVITLGVMLVMFLVTREPKWLRYAGRILLIGAVITLIFIGIYFLERFLLVI
jgi:membrane protein YdbS with pleckstrin-like domain